MGFLAGFSFLQILILLLIVIIAVGGIILLVLFKIPMKISRKWTTISTKTKNKVDLNKNLYIRKKDFMLIISKIAEKTQKQMELKFIDKLNRQMTFAEEKIIDIKSLLEEIYFGLLSKKKKTIEDDYENFKLFSGTLEIIIKNSLEILRASFRTNNIKQMDDQTFSELIDRKFQLILQKILDTFNNLYVSSGVIKGGEICECIREKNGELKRTTTEIYDNAREVDSTIREEAAKLDKELDNFLWSYLELDLEKIDKESKLRISQQA